MEQRIERLYNELIKIITPDTVFACIGAAKTTSYLDSVGPQIGDRLKSVGLPYVYGTHTMPYNGLTAESMAAKINKRHKKQTVIAIDACCTCFDNKLFKIEIAKGSMSPGAGLNKKLTSVGDYSIRAFTLKKDNMSLLPNIKLMTSGKCDYYIREVDIIVEIISKAIIKAYNDVMNKTIKSIMPNVINKEILL